MPTGVALQDPRQQLYAAAQRILLRQGPTALTSRAVTTEAGVAKGVLHRHFVDFDDFLAELVRDRIARLHNPADDLASAVGTGSITDNLTRALISWFDPATLAIVALVTSRDQLRMRLRATTPSGVPVLTEATGQLIEYLTAEQQHGRIREDANARVLAFNLIGTAHLLFAGELGALPDDSAVGEVVESIMVGAESAHPRSGTP